MIVVIHADLVSRC